METWKKKTFTDYVLKKLPVQIFKNGELIYDLPDLKEIVAYANASKGEFWEEYKRLINPHVYKVDLSDGLYDLKKELMEEVSTN